MVNGGSSKMFRNAVDHAEAGPKFKPSLVITQRLKMVEKIVTATEKKTVTER